jgi:hypothetical protein
MRPMNLKMSDQDLLQQVEKDQGSTASPFIAAPLLELTRRGIVRLNESSRQLERLTKVLIWLTVVLAVFTLILAVPEVRNIVAWLKAR